MIRGLFRAVSFPNLDNTTSEELVVIRLAELHVHMERDGCNIVQTGVFLRNHQRATVVLGEGNTSLEVETGHPLRVLRLSGDAGLLHLPHDGVDRCTRVGHPSQRMDHHRPALGTHGWSW